MNLSPQPPKLDLGEGEDSLSEEGEAAPPEGEADAWGRFEAAWPFDTVDLPGPAKAAFARLPSGERAEAVRCAPLYLAACTQRGLKHHKHAKTWLAEKGFEAFAHVPPAGQGKPGAPSVAYQKSDGTWWLHPYSPQLQRWREHERKVFGKPHPGLTRASEWPPGLGAPGADARHAARKVA